MSVRPTDDVILLVLDHVDAHHLPSTICSFQRASKHINQLILENDVRIWKRIVKSNVPSALQSDLDRLFEPTSTSASTWRDRYRLYRSWKALTRISVVADLGQVRDFGADEPVEGCKITSHVSSVLPESLIHGTHLIHRSTTVGPLNSIKTASDLTPLSPISKSKTPNHPVPHRQPTPPTRITFTEGATDTRILTQWDLDSKKEISGPSATRVICSDAIACGSRLGLLKMASLNVAELQVWELGNVTSKQDEDSKLVAEISQQPAPVAAIRIMKGLLFIGAMGGYGSLFVSFRKEDTASVVQAVEGLTISNAPATPTVPTAPAPDTSDLDPLAVMRLMRTLQGQSTTTQSNVMAHLSDRFLGGSGSASSSSSTPAAPTTLQATTASSIITIPPDHEHIIVEVRSTLEQSLPVVCSVSVAMPQRGRIMALVTPFHLVTLVRSKTTISIWELSTSKLVTTIDLAPLMKITGEIPVRLFLSDDDFGFLVHTSKDALIWVDCVKGVCQRFEKDESRNPKGGLYVLCLPEGGDMVDAHTRREKAFVGFKRFPVAEKKKK
ncbi:hypothetical protein HDU76_013836 [Blyttiomyces sp. JEL0837]|nr:hypothetical protein HDU76_013836 [Blyttiomyces sp. JEL0837]